MSAFPASPTDGQVATVNGVRYVYASTPGVWNLKPYVDPDAKDAAAAAILAGTHTGVTAAYNSTTKALSFTSTASVRNPVTGVVGNASPAAYTSGPNGATTVTVALATYLWASKPHRLRVVPDTGCTIRVESSTDGGSTYVVVADVTADATLSYNRGPGESWITHLRLTRTAGAATDSTYAIY